MVESEATSPEPDGGAASSQKPSPPRRPPVTIDLSATPVDSGEAPQSATAAVDGEPDDFAEPMEPEPLDEELLPPPPRTGPMSLTGGLPPTPLAIAAGAGALAALVIAFLAATAGLVPTPASRNAAAALERVEKLAADLAAAQTAQARISTEVQAASARLAGVEVMSHDLVTTTEQLRGLDGTAAANEALINQLAGQVSDLRAAVKSIANASPGAPGNGAEIAALSSRLDEMSAKLSALDETPVAETQTAAAARTMALAGLRAAAERGESFGDALRLLSMLGVDASLLAPLEAAKDGVPSTAQVAADFDKVGRDIVASDTAAPDENLFWRVVHQLGSVVTIRPSGPVAGTTPVAIVSRMRAAVDSGDLEAALREREGLPDTGKAASENWARETTARIALDKAIAGLAGAIDKRPPPVSEGPPA